MKKLFLLFAISLIVSGPGATAAVDTLQRIKAMRKTYLLMVLLTLGISSVSAQEITVPDDAPRETWQLVYDDYRSLGFQWNEMYSDPKYKDLTMDVTVVRGEKCLYVQGIAKKCQDSWIKIGISDDTPDDILLLWSNQPVTVSGKTLYINTGDFHYGWSPGTRHIEFSIYSDGTNATPLSLYRDLSSEGVQYATKENTGYWLSYIKSYIFDEIVVKWTSPYSPRKENGGIPEEELFEEAECYLNPRLIDKTAGIGSVNITDDEADAPIYTLSGIRVNPDRLTPGIYIRAGRKFIVR